LLTNFAFPSLALTTTPGTAPSLLYEVVDKRPRVMVRDDRSLGNAYCSQPAVLPPLRQLEVSSTREMAMRRLS
jgi:hypothetical protein